MRKALAGATYVSSALAEELAGLLRQKSDGPPHGELSNRELQVMLQIAAGKTVGCIASELFLGVKTISTYRARVLKKMNMKQRWATAPSVACRISPPT
jgi:two-component system invasion response regulator UvrY